MARCAVTRPAESALQRAITRRMVRQPIRALSAHAAVCRVRITNRTQFFMPGELPLVILALLNVRPQGGYELLRELEQRYGPAYRPSPGSIYPALAALRAE